MTITSWRVRITGCQGCGACLLTCPVHAIRPGPGGTDRRLTVLASCTGCGECAEVCPVDAIDVAPLGEHGP